MKILRSAIEKHVFTDCELQSYGRPDRWLDFHVYPTGEGAILFFRDVTEDKAANRAAARTRALLQASLDALSAHVVILDRHGVIVASNMPWRRFESEHTGRATADYRVLYADRFARFKGARRIKEALEAVIDGRKRTVRFAYSWQPADQMRWFQLSAAAFTCQNEPHVVVVNEDVTLIKEAEVALGGVAERLLNLQEEERQRIASELHDSTVQNLVAIGLNAMRLKERATADMAALGLLQEIEELLDETSKGLRTFTYLLQPPELERDGLRETLRRYVDGFGKRTGLGVKVRVSRRADALPSALQQSLFRIVQEGLTNAHRHASASRVAVDLRCVFDRLHLMVSDNGRGLAKGASRGRCRPSSGVGIRSIRARLRQFGGDMEILSGPHGTRLHAVVPFEDIELPGPVAGDGATLCNA